MEEIKLSQNTEEWLKFRLEGIGASDAPIIMGKSHFKTPRQLWDEKVNKKIVQATDNFITEKGHRIEEWARNVLEMKRGKNYPPAIFQSKQLPFIRASLDGWNLEDRTVVEIKYLGKENYENLINPDYPLLKRIPPQYFDQLVQQYFVSNCEKIILVGVSEDKAEDGTISRSLYDLEFDPQQFYGYLNNTLLPALIKFQENVVKKVPPALVRADVLEVSDEPFKKMLHDYAALTADEKIKKAETKKVSDKISRLREKIISSEFRSHSNIKTDDGFKIVERDGAEKIDYEAAFNAVSAWLINLKNEATDEYIVESIRALPDEPDLTRYKKIGKPSVAITIPKNFKIETAPIAPTNEYPIEPLIVAEPVDKPAENNDDKKDDEPVTDNVTMTQKSPVEIVSDDDATNDKWINPRTGKTPRNWSNKNHDERAKYLAKELKTARKENADAIVLTKLANAIYNLK